MKQSLLTILFGRKQHHPDPGGAHDSIFHIDRMEAATKLH